MLHLGALKADTNQPQLPAEPHHQIDFRQFFPPPEDISPAPSPEPTNALNTPRISSNLLPRSGFRGSDWLNLLFAVVTIIGGLLVSVRYFGGAESFRRATSWPREFLYPRPPSAQADAKIDNQAPLRNPSPDSKPTTIISQPRNSFRRNAKSPAKSPLRFASNGRASTSFPAAQSPTSTAGGSGESARGENSAGSRTAGSSKPGGAGRPPPPKIKPPPKSGGQTNMSEERSGGRNSGNPHANASAQQTANAQKSQRSEQSSHSDTATRIPGNNGGGGGGFGGRN
jgi:hypothetical protein